MALKQMSEAQSILKPFDEAIVLLVGILGHADVDRMQGLNILRDFLLLRPFSQVPDLIVIQDLHDLHAGIAKSAGLVPRLQGDLHCNTSQMTA